MKRESLLVNKKKCVKIQGVIIRLELLLQLMIRFGKLEGWFIIYGRNLRHKNQGNTFEEDSPWSFNMVKMIYGVGTIFKVLIKSESMLSGENEEWMFRFILINLGHWI